MARDGIEPPTRGFSVVAVGNPRRPKRPSSLISLASNFAPSWPESSQVGSGQLLFGCRKNSETTLEEWRQLLHGEHSALAVVQVHVRGAFYDEQFLRARSLA